MQNIETKVEQPAEPIPTPLASSTSTPIIPAPALLGAFLSHVAQALPQFNPRIAFGRGHAGSDIATLPTARVYLAEEYVQHPARIESTQQGRLVQTVRAELCVALFTPTLADTQADPLQDFEQARRAVMHALVGVVLPDTLRPLQFVRCTLRQPTKVTPGNAYVRQDVTFVTFYKLALDVR
jgi:hypothetical protein